MPYRPETDSGAPHAASTGAGAGGVSGRVVVVAFLTLLVVATVAVYVIVFQLKRGGTEALRENKERRVPAAAEAARRPPATAPSP